MTKDSTYIVILLLSACIFSQSLELDFGWHNPQGSFDKYNEPGTSFRATYSNVGSKEHIKYDLSFQYLNFMSDSWIEDSSFPMTVTHSEQSWAILYGPRIMSPTRRGYIKPYFGVKGGFFIFSETMKYEWQDDWDAWDWACLFFDIIDDDNEPDDFDCFDDNNNHYKRETKTLKQKFGTFLLIIHLI